MMIPFQLTSEIEIVSDNAAIHSAVVLEELSEIPALCRYRMTSQSAGKPVRSCRRSHRQRSIHVTLDLCSDRWECSHPDGNKSLDCFVSLPAEQHSHPKSQIHHGMYCLSPRAHAFDRCPRKPHRSDSYSFADDCHPARLMSVLGDALNLGGEINERLAQLGLPTEPSQVQVVARTG